MPIPPSGRRHPRPRRRSLVGRGYPMKVLVTGGTSGLGLAMAAALSQAGATVALTGRSGRRAGAVAADLPGAVGIELDVRDESSVARAVDETWSRLGGIDLLVNNAGIGMRTVNPRFMTDPQGFWEVPVDGFRAVIETNLTGYFLVAREVAPRMLATGGGRIVNISVSRSTMYRAGFVPYGPSRAGRRRRGTARRSPDSEGGLQATHRAVPGEHVELTRFHDEATAVVVEAEVGCAQGEGHRGSGARVERHPLEPAQPPYRLGDAGHRVVQVQLHHLVTGAAAGVRHVHRGGDGTPCGDRCGAEPQVGDREGGVAEPVA